MKDNKEILKHYLHALLWTEGLDGNRDIEEIKGKNLEKCQADVNMFIEKAGTLLNELSEEQIGHDFWLSRNGHGAGFFDRGLGEIGDKLQELSRTFKGVDVFADSDLIIIE
jgi:hypothetical protein